MLSMTTGDLELISDYEMYLFFKKSMKYEFFIFVIVIVKPTISI